MRDASRVVLCASGLLLMGGAAAHAQDAVPGAMVADPTPRVRLLREYKDSVKVAGRDETRIVRLYFDYAKGTTRQTVQDEKGVVLDDKIIAGQPRPTDEEIAEAIAIVRADRILGGMLARVKAVPDGGFVLEEGEGKACGPRTRCLHVFWLSPDRVGLVRWTVVDLVSRTIAYRSYHPPEENPTGGEVGR
jgi:hypothetical protein